MTRIAVAILSLLVTPSCMTFDTRGDPTYDGSRVYSGTRVDAKQAALAFRDFNLAGFVLFGGDLPLSLIADTVLLPVSVPEETARRRRVREDLRVDVDRPSLLGDDTSGTTLELAERLFDVCRKLLEKNQPQVVHCYGLRSEIHFAGGEPAQLDGAAYKTRIRAALADAQRSGNLYTWRDPAYTEQDERVRVDAVLWSALGGELGPVVLSLGPDSDGQWRILRVDDALLR